MNRSELRDMLVGEGYRARVDEDGVVVFRAAGMPFVLQTDAKDGSYVRLALEFAHGDDIPRARTLDAANTMNALYKAIKSTVSADGRGVRFSLEAFYAEPAHLAPFLPRICTALKAVSDEYFATVRSSDSADYGVWTNKPTEG